MAVNRLAVVVAEIGQVQSRLVVELPQPGLQYCSTSWTSSSRPCDRCFLVSFDVMGSPFNSGDAACLPGSLLKEVFAERSKGTPVLS